MSKITLTMIVRNEAGRYLRDVLQSHLDYIDEAVIIDDGSDDETPWIIWELLSNIPLHLIRNQQSRFHSEFLLRQQQWNATIATKPEWILNMDADERFESGAGPLLREITDSSPVDVVSFRLYDMWSETHYREDTYWNAHLRPVPLLVRHNPERNNAWQESVQHCGRFPIEVYSEKMLYHPLRVQHFGWAKEEDRIAKFKRYKQLDPQANYGFLEQYESILDPAPNLVEWK